MTANTHTESILSDRRIVHRTRGHGDGAIVRLMSPSDLGQHLKPFVFLDIFEAEATFAGKMPIHPHSGIATITVITEGDARYDDPDAGTGVITYGGAEWMRAGKGVWHGQEMSRGHSTRLQGFQLWIALPSDLENGSVDSQYLEADLIPVIGPARVVVGRYAGVQSPVRSPVGINYLLVTLQPGEEWTYCTPAGHQVGFVAVSRGALVGDLTIAAGELAVLDYADGEVHFRATSVRPTTFVLGSAVPHPHELALGYYSVHTSADALAIGEAEIARLGERMRATADRRNSSGAVPVYR